MKPHVIIFVGTTHDIHWYNRPSGAYKLATYLRQNGFRVQVIINCTSLTRAGYQQVFDTYGSEDLLWIGFTSNWLSGKKNEDYYNQWDTSSDLIISEQNLSDEWFFVDVTNREEYYSCVYSTSMFNDIWNMAKKYYRHCQLIFGGTSLNRNEYFSPKYLVPEAIYIKNNAEVPVLELTKRLSHCNLNLDNLPNNDEYNYGDFKTSFIDYQDTDHIDSNEWLPIEISRGCAFNCAFCNYDMKNVTDNYVDSKTLKENIIRNYERWGTTKFVIMDDLYNDNFDKVRDLYEICWSQLPFKPELAGYLRLDLLWKRPDQAQLLLDSGFKCGSFGIETLNDKAGKAVGKGLGKKRILETLEMLKEVWKDEILIHAFFIAGLPHENYNSLIDTVTWTKSTDLVHGIIWQWLELENIRVINKNVDKISILGQNPQKYGYQFLNNTDWVNDVGLTLEQCKEINKIGNQVKPNTFFTVYADQRALGRTHSDLLKGDFMEYLNWVKAVKLSAVTRRTLKIITPTKRERLQRQLLLNQINSICH